MNMRTPQPLLEANEGEVPINGEVDFSEYMWMGEELEEFDRQVEEELWEEAFIEACFEEMMAEENGPSHSSNTNNNNYSSYQPQQPPPHHHNNQQPPPHHHNNQQQYIYNNNLANLEDTMKRFNMRENPKKDELVKNSSLNPEAPEFIPGNYMKR
ncbi:hypothetical protein SNE40_017430 [Patella caerulea]